MKRYAIFAVLIVFAISLVGCVEQEISVGDMIYTYEGEGFGSDFTISIYSDGTFSCYVGMLSSYIGIGAWSLDGDVLTLTEGGLLPSISDGDGVSTRNNVNHFRVEGDTLYFIEEGSSNFGSLMVQDGECFHGAPMDETETKPSIHNP